MEYKISKARIKQLIKEEYEAAYNQEDEAEEKNALESLIWKWHEAGKEIPVHLTVARMIEDGNLEGAIDTIEDLRGEREEVEQPTTESVGSLRDLIKQEIAKL